MDLPSPDASPSRLEKLVVCVVAVLINAFIYMVPNRVQLKEPVYLSMTQVDTWVPFVPATIWIYLSDYVLVASAYMFSRTWGDVRRFARAYFALLAAGAAVHLLWPTTFPRERFPVSGDQLTSLALVLLREFDLPTSCFPSMHVAGSFLAVLTLYRQPRRVWLMWGLWAALICVSTLTAKQHYAVDVAGGVAIAVLFWWAFYWLPDRRAATRSAALEVG